MFITSNFVYTFILLLIIQFSLHSLATDAAQLQCKNIYRNSQDADIDLSNKPITDIDSFGRAMTSGMQLHAEQSDLFEVYRAMFLGDPNVSVDGKTLKSVTDILAKHPELEKPMFREYTISAVEKVYSSPDSLNKFVQSQFTTAGQIRNNLFQVKANLGYWKKLLDYQDPPMPDSLIQMQKKLQTLQQGLGKAEPTAELVQLKEKYRTAKANYDNSNTIRFRRYLNKIINNANQDLLADLTNEHSSYIQKATALFEMFRYLEEWMSKQGRNTQTLRQAMVDLVFTVGFGNQSTLELLRSPNGLDKIQGLNQLWNECESLAEQLRFAGHFVELKQNLRIEFPTGLSKNMDFVSSIQNLEKQVLAMPFSTRPTETIRVRSLSIQESPFRSCLGLDCSTRTYFDKALDPNYIYFTMTRFDHKSSGHATVVLGTATDAKNRTAIKVAFLDKLQNIPTQQIEFFLSAVNKSLQDSGYRLAIPTDLGKDIAGHGGLSNMSGITDFVQLNIMPRLNNKLSAFTPHAHQYQFKNAYSRADQKLEVRLFTEGSLGSDIEIKPGNKNKSYNADKSLDKKQLISEFLKLRDSKNEEDQIKFIKSSGLIPHLEKMNLYSRNKFETDLNKLLEDKNNSIAVRKSALFELIIKDHVRYFDANFIKHKFTDAQSMGIFFELRQWENSSDNSKKKVFVDIAEQLFKIIFISNKNIRFELRKDALFSLIMINPNGYTETLLSLSDFADNQKLAIQAEVQQWTTSSDQKKNRAISEIGIKLNESILSNVNHSFITRKAALFELIMKNPKKYFDIFISGQYFTEEQRGAILLEIREWGQISNLSRRKDVFYEVRNNLYKAIISNNKLSLEIRNDALLEIIFKINTKSSIENRLYSFADLTGVQRETVDNVAKQYRQHWNSRTYRDTLDEDSTISKIISTLFYESIFLNKTNTFENRKLAIFKILKINYGNHYGRYKYIDLLLSLPYFTETQGSTIYSEIKKWEYSTDIEEKSVYHWILEDLKNEFKKISKEMEMDSILKAQEKIEKMLKMVNINSVLRGNYTLLNYVLYRTHLVPEVVKKMLQDPQLKTETFSLVNDVGESILHEALKYTLEENSEIFLMIFNDPRLSSEAFNYESKYDGTILHFAASRVTPEIFRMILDDQRLNNNTINKTDKYGQTVLHFAIYNSTILKMVLEDPRLSAELINVKDENGRTALSEELGRRQPDPEIIELLKAHGATE